ncbi:thioredoxin family protein [Psychrosphaera aquimarina]|uniref:Thioredoxin family protein n=1 Tax=Psychrosphaera aquimarina TaxID=2044854 RepID=A0ABU3R0U0_9GAMM|nr:thioredoxin family protein [Psychrosphaera aquimarina]MDU0113295.1 thioredoxin family protein [Psychrosphaera aquimarina]
MKITHFFKIALIFCFFLISNISLAEDSKYYVGEISAPDILSSFPTFASHIDDVSYNDAQLNKLANLTGDIQIKVFFGQWCHDSAREVPRIITMLNQVNNANISAWFYGLDTSKSDPLMLAQKHDIKKTPTIIVYQNGVELGRILEFPQLDWATDISRLFES